MFKKLLIFSSLFLILGVANVYSQVAAPTDLTGEVVFRNNIIPEVHLTWEDAINPAQIKYNVWRKEGENGHFTRIAFNISIKSYVDKGVKPNKAYSYYVRAYLSNTLYSAPSNEVSVSIVPPPPPVKAVVTGIITNEADNQPIRNAFVKFFQSNAAINNVVVRTDSFGNFKARLIPGNYFLYTQAMGFTPEYYDNVNTFQQATAIPLNEADSLNIEVSLTPVVPPTLYSLSGSVKDSLANPIPSFVRVYRVRLNSHFQPVKMIPTDSLGNFTIPVRQNDTVVVYAQPRNILAWYPEFYDNKSIIAEADRIPVIGDITGIDFVLSHKPVYNNGISGQVKDEQGEGVESFVSAFGKRVNIHPIMLGGLRKYTTLSDTLGNYSFTNLLPNEYKLLACPKEGFKPSYFTYSGTPTINWRLADSVVLGETDLLTGIDITVLPLPEDSGFAGLRGKVRDNAGQPINGAFIYAINPSNEVYSYAISNTNGDFEIAGLVPDEYFVIADKEEYNSNSGQLVSVNYNVQNSGLSFTLTPDGVLAVEDKDLIATDFALYQNYPNPFNPTTVISYQIPEMSKVTLKVYNVIGKEVATLVNEFQAAGKHTITFDARNLATGVYFYRIDAGSFSATKKLTLVK